MTMTRDPIGLFEKTGAVCHLDVTRTNPAPLDAPLVPRPPPSPRAADAAAEAPDLARHALERRLRNPRWRFAGLPEKVGRKHAACAATAAAKRAPGREEIVGFTLVEVVASAPLTHGLADAWRWSRKLLDAGTVDWDNDGSSPLQDMVNRFRESTDQARVAVAYCPHTKLSYNQIAAADELPKLPNYARWLDPPPADGAPAPPPPALAAAARGEGGGVATPA